MQLQSNSGYQDTALPYHNPPLHYNFKHLAGEKTQDPQTLRAGNPALIGYKLSVPGAGGEAGAQVSACFCSWEQVQSETGEARLPLAHQGPSFTPSATSP